VHVTEEVDVVVPKLVSSEKAEIVDDDVRVRNVRHKIYNLLMEVKLKCLNSFGGKFRQILRSSVLESIVEL